MNITFNLPITPTCRVVYTRDGTLYGAVIATPDCNTKLQAVMLERRVGMSQIQRVEPIEPRKEWGYNHPASHRMAKYASAADH